MLMLIPAILAIFCPLSFFLTQEIIWPDTPLALSSLWEVFEQWRAIAAASPPSMPVDLNFCVNPQDLTYLFNCPSPVRTIVHNNTVAVERVIAQIQNPLLNWYNDCVEALDGPAGLALFTTCLALLTTSIKMLYKRDSRVGKQSRHSQSTTCLIPGVDILPSPPMPYTMVDQQLEQADHAAQTFPSLSMRILVWQLFHGARRQSIQSSHVKDTLKVALELVCALKKRLDHQRHEFAKHMTLADPIVHKLGSQKADHETAEDYQQRNAVLLSTVTALETKLRGSKQELEEARLELARANRDVEEWSVDLGKALADTTTVHKELQATKNQVENLQSQLDSATNRVIELEGLSVNTNTVNDRTDAMAVEFHHQLKEQEEKHEQAIKAMQARHDTMQRESSDRCKDLARRNQELESAKVMASSKYSQLQNTVSLLKSERTSAESKVDTKQRTIDLLNQNLEAEKRALQSQASEANFQNYQLEKQVARLQAELEVAKAPTKPVEMEKPASTVKVPSTSNDEELRELKLNNTELKKSIQADRATINKQKAQIGRLETEVTMSRRDLELAQTTNDVQANELKKQISVLRMEMFDLEKQLEKAAVSNTQPQQSQGIPSSDTPNPSVSTTISKSTSSSSPSVLPVAATTNTTTSASASASAAVEEPLRGEDKPTSGKQNKETQSISKWAAEPVEEPHRGEDMVAAEEQQKPKLLSSKWADEPVEEPPGGEDKAAAPKQQPTKPIVSKWATAPVEEPHRGEDNTSRSPPARTTPNSKFAGVPTAPRAFHNGTGGPARGRGNKQAVNQSKWA